jgi:murein DD-endopeptidase MepM/ murein hydrolase activator NlpD
MIPALIGCFYGGVIVGWLLHRTFTPGATAPAATPEPIVMATSGDVRETSGRRADPIEELRSHHLQLPIDNVDVAAMQGGFAEKREGSERGHEAVDMLAPRNTPIHAVESGTIAKLFDSKAGGTTIYQFDPTRRFCYYYAHLERYADGVAEGHAVARGDVIGYVGTSGNAPPNTPHLHFAIFELGSDQRWWEGTPLDPYLVFKK